MLSRASFRLLSVGVRRMLARYHSNFEILVGFEQYRDRQCDLVMVVLFKNVVWWFGCSYS